MTNPTESVEYLLGRIESKIDQVRESHQDLAERLRSHGERLTSLELRASRAVGWLTGAAAVGGTVAAIIQHLLK